MRVLIVTQIFPNASAPLSSPFNRQQFAALGRIAGVDVEVLATVPWFPGEGLLKKRASAIPAQETIEGLRVFHPRTAYVPRYGHAFSAALYAASVLPAIAERRRRNDLDVLLGAWAYPDAAALVALGALLRIPTVVKCHGSDINVIAKRPVLRWQLQQTLPRANHVVVVSRALGGEVAALGVDPARITVVQNGVDGTLFHLRDRAGARRALAVAAERRLIVYVGRLEREKGVMDLLDAFDMLAKNLPDVDLALVGDGKARADVEARAQRWPGRILLPGACRLPQVPEWLAAADIVTLPSWNEGTPNAVLEALACGRRVVATNVGGIPDVITDPRLGIMVPRQAPSELATALEAAINGWYDPADVATCNREMGQRGNWQDSAQSLLAVLDAAHREGAR